MQPELKVLGTLASDASARPPGAGTQTDGGDVRVDGPVQLPDLKRTLPMGVEGKVASCVLTSLPRVIAEDDDLWAAPGAAQLQWRAEVNVKAKEPQPQSHDTNFLLSRTLLNQYRCALGTCSCPSRAVPSLDIPCSYISVDEPPAVSKQRKPSPKRDGVRALQDSNTTSASPFQTAPCCVISFPSLHKRRGK